MQAVIGARTRKGLRVGVGGHELDALQIGLDHVVDGIAAGAAHSEHEYPGFEFLGHGAPLFSSASAGLAERRTCALAAKKRLSGRK